MGHLATSPRPALSGWSRPLVVFLVVLIFTAAVPAAATVYDYVYSSNTGTIQSPTVTLQAGTAGSSAVSPVAADAATLTATASLKFYENNSAVVSSVAIDGASSGATTGKKTSLSVSITTTKTNDIIYLLTSGATGETVTGVSDTSSLTWTLRQTEDGNGVRVEAWYAVSSGVLSGDSVTVTFSTNDKYSATVFGVSGTDTASPFAPSFPSAQVATGSGILGSISVTTTNANDLVVAGVSVQYGAAVTINSPLAQIALPQSPSETGVAGYDEVTSTLSSVSMSFGWLGTGGWAMIADAFAEAIPAATPDSGIAVPGSPNLFSLPALSSAYIWSPAYPVASTMYTGTWTVDYWGSGATAGTLNVDVYVMNSANAVVATLVSSGSTGSFGTTLGEVISTLASVPGATVPSGGTILLVLTAPKGGPASFTINWGTGQLSNFQTPSTYNYLLAITNTGTSTWNVNLATTASQTSLLGRLTSTISFVSPASNQIIVAGGSVTQYSGSAVTLAASGTIDIQLVATASALPSASSTPSTITFSIKVASTTSTAYSQYTVILTVN